nr:hypothetical protein [Tanacetum cinerariifolium]
LAKVIQLVLRRDVPVEVVVGRESQHIAARRQLNLRYRVDAGVGSRARYLRQETRLGLRKAAAGRVGQLGEVRNAGIGIEHGLYRAAQGKRVANQADSLVGSRDARIFDEELLNKRLFFKDYTTINPPEPPPANISVFTPIAGSPVELLLEDPRIQHLELREYVRKYADFEPFQRLLRIGIRYMTMVPMWLNGRLTGFLILATVRPSTYSAADEQLLEKITSLVAVAVRNTLDFEEVARREQQRS